MAGGRGEGRRVLRRTVVSDGDLDPVVVAADCDNHFAGVGVGAGVAECLLGDAQGLAALGVGELLATLDVVDGPVGRRPVEDVRGLGPDALGEGPVRVGGFEVEQQGSQPGRCRAYLLVQPVEE